MAEQFSSEPLLAVKGLQIRFRNFRVVRDLSFDIQPGEMLALVGESGSGKSVTALSIMGLLSGMAGAEATGKIRFGGRNLLELEERDWQHIRGNEIAMIFQEPMTALNPVFTIGFQIGEVLKKHQHLHGAALKARILKMLSEVEIPDPERCCGEYPHQLSGGMRQRVMIAIALACRPKLLIADEPTTALDVTVQAQIMKLLDVLRREYHTSILFITHNLALISQYADRCAVMYAGNIVEQAPIGELFAEPCHPYTRMLLQAMPRNVGRNEKLAAIHGAVAKEDNAAAGCPFARRCPLADASCRDELPPVCFRSEDHLVFCRHWQNTLPVSGEKCPAGQAGEGEAPVLYIRHLRVEYPIRSRILQRKTGTVKVVNDLSLDLHAGETLALVGESGCGKTTVGKSIIRLLEPSGGKICFHGKDDLLALSKGEMQEYRRKIQMVFQDPFSSFNPRMTVGESIREGIEIHHLARTEEEIQMQLQQLFLDTGMDIAEQHRYPHQFSGGQRQRLGLARALAVRPEILICDECTSALDVSIQAQILNLLKDLQKKYALSYLFITHDLSVVKYLADRVAVMYQGKIVELASNQEIFSSPQHPYTKMLLQAAGD